MHLSWQLKPDRRALLAARHGYDGLAGPNAPPIPHPVPISFPAAPTKDTICYKRGDRRPHPASDLDEVTRRPARTVKQYRPEFSRQEGVMLWPQK